MKTRAAVAFGAGKPLEICEVELEGPRAGEVMVELKATGVCHTDAFTLSGDDPEGAFPTILGHEGAGVVVEVGEGVTSVKPGDHVIPLYTPECRECDFCLHPRTNLCQAIRETQGQGVMPDGSSRFSLDGKPLLHYMGCSTFANHTVLPEIAVAKVREDAPFDKICYIGCGVTTGIGAVAFTMKVEAGATVAVFGLGGIGLNVIQGARMVGASRIIGVDMNPAKEALGRQFGMTDFVNPKDVDDVTQHLIAMTGGGVDFVGQQGLVHKNASRRKAEALLLPHAGEQGAFLVRTSRKKAVDRDGEPVLHTWAMSLVAQKGFQHHLLYVTQAGTFKVNGWSLPGSVCTLSQAVAHLQRTPVGMSTRLTRMIPAKT